MCYNISKEGAFSVVHAAGPEKWGLTNNQLKVIAMVTMFIDHVGHALFPGVVWLRIVGRLSFPIFAYMIAEGCRYTKNRRDYLLKIAALALGCQVVYALAMRDFYQGVLVTFSFAVGIVFSLDHFLRKKTPLSLCVAVTVVAGVLVAVLILPKMLSGTGYGVDYGIWGVLLPVAVYYAPGKREKLAAAGMVLILLALSIGVVQWFGLLALPLLALYNGQRGKWKMKYAFYIFYPAHLALVYLIGLLIS